MSKIQHKVNFLSAGLNSEFSFSLTECHTKFKEPGLANYLSITEGCYYHCHNYYHYYY